MSCSDSPLIDSPPFDWIIDVFCDTEGRCLNAIPRTMIQSKGGESIRGCRCRTELIAYGPGLPRRSGSLARPTSSASASRTARSLSPTSTRASAAVPAAARRRQPLSRSWRSLSPRGENPEPRLGEFRAGVVMTRFFSDLLPRGRRRRRAVPLRRGAARADRRRAGRGLSRALPRHRLRRLHRIAPRRVPLTGMGHEVVGLDSVHRLLRSRPKARERGRPRPQHRGLARSGRPEDREQLPVADGQVGALDRDHLVPGVAELLADADQLDLRIVNGGARI